MSIRNFAKAETVTVHAPLQGVELGISQSSDAELSARGRKLVVLMGGGSVVMLLMAGGLLWWRDGERLFTEGLISAIARCF